ncbi:hypothetical protein FOMA001_g19023 [Fusarium oxysporum f. sp. matthiolae]|nr:hypothetical protein FOMA001_g19023 [Fusarium oxysporum f. sp. matthiolae]
MAQIKSEEEWQLTQQTFNNCREMMSLATERIGPWVERMVIGYEARDRHEEAWQLTQQTFNNCREMMSLATERIGPWVERMVIGYEARDRHEEAWQLTQQTFNTFRAKGCRLSAEPIGPWVERMVIGYEARDQHEEAWQLTQQLYDAYAEQQLPYRMLGGMGVLFRLLYAFQSSRRPTDDAALLSMIPKQGRLDLIASNKLSISCRSLLSRSLRDDRDGCALIRLRLGEGSNELQVHQDILCYWSKYFDRALSGRWPVPEVFDLNPDNEFSPESLMRIFDNFIYAGNYKGESSEGRDMERKIAEYFQIDQLIRVLQ